MNINYLEGKGRRKRRGGSRRKLLKGFIFAEANSIADFKGKPRKKNFFKQG